MNWIRRSKAWEMSETSFRDTMRISKLGWTFGVYVPTLLLIAIPPAAGAIVAYITPPSGLGCRSCWIAGRRHACLGGSIQNHKNKASLYGKKSLESGRLGQIVYKYRASPTVRSTDFIIPMHHFQKIHSSS
jgi:hypothetical protein